MKVALIIAAFAIIGACAEIPEFKCEGSKFSCMFKELGHQITHHSKNLGNKLAEVGTAVLSSAIDSGKDLLANGAQAVLGTVLKQLTEVTGKREIGLMEKVGAHVKSGMAFLQKAKEGIHAAFKKAVEKITGVVSNFAALKKIDDKADKEIDDAVEEFNKEGKKGFFAMASTIAQKLQSIIAEGMAQIKAKFTKKDDAKRAILGLSSLSNALSNAASALGDAFKPHLATLSNAAKDLANKAKDAASTVVDGAKSSFSDLKDKLQGQVDALKGHVSKLGDHAKNAVGALKDAVTDILSQTVGNVSDTVGDITGVGSDAVGTVVDHVSGN